MASQPHPNQYEVERAFSDAMAALGFTPGPIQANTQGFVRFDAPGDKAKRENGFYKLMLGRFPVGWFGDWKNGVSHQWHFDDGRELTKQERDEIKREQRRLKIEADVAREAKQREIAEKASEIWKKASTDTEGHPYLIKKQVKTPRGLRVHKASDGKPLLCVPMWRFDMNGQPALTNLQMIDPDGTKIFLKAGRVQGTFFSLKGDTSIIIICEGYATGNAIWQSTGLSVVCAFNSGNLIEVAKEFAMHRPLATIMIAGDDDQTAPDDWAVRGQGRTWENAGAKKAEAAAKAIGCRWILPVFQKGPARGRTDYDDLREQEGEKAVAAQIMGAFKAVQAQDAEPGATIIEPDFTRNEAWRTELPRNGAGNSDPKNVEGVARFIANHRLLRDRLAYNTFTNSVEIDGNEMADHHVAEFRRIMHNDMFKAAKTDVADEMLADARRRQHDPLSDYLNGLAWDGKNRIDSWLTDYMSAEAGMYSMMVGRKFLISAVARALLPGCKVDTMLVFEGDQGTGKSTAIRYLFGDRFFTDVLSDFHSKDSFQQIQGVWCTEIGELASMSKAEVNDVKLFLSRLVDRYRPPFARLPVNMPRRVVFCGSVNPDDVGYLRDSTGARRFWPLKTGAINLNGLLLDRDQIWAEAVVSFHNGEAWHLVGDDLIAEAKVQQEERREVHPWEEKIADYVRQNHNSQLTIGDVLGPILNLSYDKQTTSAARTAGSCLRGLGWAAKNGRVNNFSKITQIFYPPD